MQEPPASEDDIDAGLVQAVARGDRNALALLYERHASAVYGIAMVVVRDHAVAQDVSQEAFVRLWTRAHTFDPRRGSALGWLLAVTRNLALDELRRQRRGLDRAERLARDAQLSVGTEFDHLLGRRQDAQQVLEAMRGLSSIQRETVELVYFHGYTLGDVAERLQVAVGTVKSRLHSALVNLRASLAEQTSTTRSRSAH